MTIQFKGRWLERIRLVWILSLTCRFFRMFWDSASSALLVNINRTTKDQRLPKHHAEAISTLQLSPDLLKELMMAISSRKKKTCVFVRNRSTAPGGEPKASRPSSLHERKRKAKEMASSGDSIEPANRRPASGAASAPLAAISSVTGDLAAVGSRQLGPP